MEKLSMKYEVCTITNNEIHNIENFYEIDLAMEYVDTLDKDNFYNIVINIYIINEFKNDEQYMDCMTIR